MLGEARIVLVNRGRDTEIAADSNQGITGMNMGSAKSGGGTPRRLFYL